jgi:hypothetical protein
MSQKVLETAKFWVALVGIVVTALLGTVGKDDAAFDWLTAIAGVCTALGVYLVPNAPAPGGGSRVAGNESE